MKKKSILERLKLVDYFTTEIPIEKNAFVKKFATNVDRGDVGLFLSAFEVFSSSDNEYKGIVTSDAFKIRRRRRLFDMSLNLAVAEGRFKQRENILVVEATINGFRGVFIPFLIFISIFYVLAIVSVIVSDAPDSTGWFVIPAILFHATFMLMIPYLIMRRSVSRMKYELERDLFFLTR